MQRQPIELNRSGIGTSDHTLLYNLVIPKPCDAIVAAALDDLKMIVAGRQTSGVRNFYGQFPIIGTGVLPVHHSLSHGIRAIDIGKHNSAVGDRKSTRLNSSHVAISYAVFC